MDKSISTHPIVMDEGLEPPLPATQDLQWTLANYVNPSNCGASGTRTDDLRSASAVL